MVSDNNGAQLFAREDGGHTAIFKPRDEFRPKECPLNYSELQGRTAAIYPLFPESKKCFGMIIDLECVIATLQP